MKNSILIFVLTIFLIPNSYFASAMGLVAVEKEKSDSLISALTGQVNVDSVQGYIQALQDMETRFMIAPNRNEVAQWIKSKFHSFGIENVRIDSTISNTFISMWNLHFDTTTWQYNVIATIPGMENTDQYYVIGAHYDDVVAPDGDPMIYAPGADDNASGVAALFEIARLMMLNNYHPKTSIEFVAFGAEELMNFGECGSQGYVNDLVANDVDVQLMINNDMIANTSSSNWTIKVFNYVGCEWLTDLTVDIISSFTQIEPDLPNPASYASGDCKYFYEADIPCVYLMEKNFNPFYHSEDDLAINCEMDYCAEAIKISLGVLVAADNPLTGVNETFNLSEALVYPNPSNGILNIYFSDSQYINSVAYHVFDLTGKILLEGYFTGGWNQSISLEDLADGIYFLQMFNNGDIYTAKVRLQK